MQRDTPFPEWLVPFYSVHLCVFLSQERMLTATAPEDTEEGFHSLQETSESVNPVQLAFLPVLALPSL